MRPSNAIKLVQSNKKSYIGCIHHLPIYVPIYSIVQVYSVYIYIYIKGAPWVCQVEVMTRAMFELSCVIAP